MVTVPPPFTFNVALLISVAPGLIVKFFTWAVPPLITQRLGVLLGIITFVVVVGTTPHDQFAGVNQLLLVVPCQLLRPTTVIVKVFGVPVQVVAALV